MQIPTIARSAGDADCDTDCDTDGDTDGDGDIASMLCSKPDVHSRP